MNTSKFDNRRHKSVLNPVNLAPFHKSPFKSNGSSKDVSVFNREANSNSNGKYPKMNVQTNTLFAYQEFDQFTSFLENTKPVNYNSQASNQVNNNNNNADSLSSQDSSGDAESISEDIDRDMDFRAEYYLKDKRKSVMMPLPFNNNGYFNINSNNGSANCYMNNSPYGNYSNITPYQVLQYNLAQYGPKSLEGQRRLSSCFNPMNNSINNYINNYNSNSNSISTRQSQSKSSYGVKQSNVNCKLKDCPNANINILDHLPRLLKDQQGCLQIQEKLEEMKNNPEYIKQVHKKIESNLVELINDKFGNYFIQKLIEILIYQHSSQFIADIFVSIQNDLYSISLNQFGTRFIQKSLDKMENSPYSQIETPTLNNVFKHLIEKYIFYLCNDKNGNHVFQKILRIYPKEHNDFIYRELNRYAIDIAKLKQGVIIFQTAFKCASMKQREDLVNRILSDIGSLINDEYGNYMIHYIIQLNEKEFNETIYAYISENIIALSKKKFSSNVLDKYIAESDDALKLIKHVVNRKLVKELIVDQYGNYVIQKALSYAKGNLFMKMIKQIASVMESLKKSSIGRKVYDNLMGKYEEYFNKTLMSSLKYSEDKDEDEGEDINTIIINADSNANI